MRDKSVLSDNVTAVVGRARGPRSEMGIEGVVVAELFGPDGTLKARVESRNLVTAVGDQMYAARGAGVGSAPDAPTGMKLGTGDEPVAKSGSGAALETYLSDSDHAFDATYPSATGGVVTYRTTWAAGEATSANPITEAVIVNDTLSDTTSSSANTISRVLLDGIGSKGAGDTLQITWTHTLLGA